MLYCSMDIPVNKKQENETCHECFLRIMETFMGELYVMTSDQIKVFKNWLKRSASSGSFPVSWIEDENGNIIEYYIRDNNQVERFTL